MLAKQAYAVFAANSGEVALQFMESTIPDLILLDVKMPDMDGYEVCQRIKKDERLREVPVIFVSVNDAAWDKVKAFSVGGVDYIVKPIEEAEVLARLETPLTLSSLRNQLEQKVKERTAEVLKAKADLYTNQMLLKSIIDSSNAVIYVKDLEGYYLLVNNRFQDLFGGPSADFRGLTDRDIFTQKIADALRETDQQIIDSGSPMEVEEVLFHDTEHRAYISVKSPLRDLNGNISAVCCIATDITERVREEATLRELNELLERRLSERLVDSNIGTLSRSASLPSATAIPDANESANVKNLKS